MSSRTETRIGPMAPAIMWFRRDLRLADNPALLAAASSGPLIAVFVLDPALCDHAGAARLTFLHSALRDLDQNLRALGGKLTLRAGRPEVEIPALARRIGAGSVHVAADFGPYGARRDSLVADTLAASGVTLVRTGSPYAVAPGRVVNAAGEPYRVFTPFYRAWRRHGWRLPAHTLDSVTSWAVCDSDPLPGSLTAGPNGAPIDGDGPGESGAAARWATFRAADLAFYPQRRNQPSVDGTSYLSAHLKFGTIHPRTLLADLGPDDDAFARQIAWREFYAAVLHFWPHSARDYFQPAMADLPWAHGTVADEHFDAWQRGRTGYPLVDAGMRQLVATGWMHNRVRMVTASFLVKDLHIDWRRGARHFMRYLVDGDLANNQHGWQWVAGTGTDAAPYFRVINPTTQAKRFDPSGDYIRRWVPELHSLPATEIHTPWTRGGGLPAGYPQPIVDHSEERRILLADYEALRSTTRAANRNIHAHEEHR